MTSTTNILFVIPSLGRRGTERQLVELLRGLHDPQFRFDVVTLVDISPSYTQQVEALGIPVTCLNCRGRLDYLRAIGTVSRFIKERDIHIVHGFLNLGSWVAAIAGRRCGVKVVASSIRDARDSVRSLKYYRAMTSRLAHVFTSNSKAGFDNRYPTWGENFQVVYNGIDMARFDARHAMRETYRRELSLRDDQRCVAMVAALSEHKDYESYIDAAALVQAQRDDIAFISVGDGPKREAIHAYAATKGNPVTFLGARSDVDTLWSVIDVSVMLTNTALIEEGLPNSVMESLACGIPVIANNAGGTVEVIDHGQNGHLLDRPDPETIATLIMSWLDDAELYASLSASAIRKVEQSFSYERFLDTHRALYRELHTPR